MMCASLDPGLGTLGLAHPHRWLACSNTTACYYNAHACSLEDSIGPLQLQRHCPHFLERLCRSYQPQNHR